MQGREGSFKIMSKKGKKVFAKDGALGKNQLVRGKCMREWHDPCQRPRLVNHKKVLATNKSLSLRE